MWCATLFEARGEPLQLRHACTTLDERKAKTHNQARLVGKLHKWVFEVAVLWCFQCQALNYILLLGGGQSGCATPSQSKKQGTPFCVVCNAARPTAASSLAHWCCYFCDYRLCFVCWCFGLLVKDKLSLLASYVFIATDVWCTSVSFHALSVDTSSHLTVPAFLCLYSFHLISFEYCQARVAPHKPGQRAVKTERKVDLLCCFKCMFDIDNAAVISLASIAFPGFALEPHHDMSFNFASCHFNSLTLFCISFHVSVASEHSISLICGMLFCMLVRFPFLCAIQRVSWYSMAFNMASFLCWLWSSLALRSLFSN